MPPSWPHLQAQFPPGVDLNALLRDTGLAFQKEGYPPKLEFVLREQCIRKARIREREDGSGRILVEDHGDAYALFDQADFAGVDFVEFEAARLTYIDRFERALNEAVAAARDAAPAAPGPAQAPPDAA